MHESGTPWSHSGAGSSGSRANSIAIRDPCDGCSLWAAVGTRWPSSKPWSQGRVSCGCSRPNWSHAVNVSPGSRPNMASLHASRHSWCHLPIFGWAHQRWSHDLVGLAQCWTCGRCPPLGRLRCNRLPGNGDHLVFARTHNRYAVLTHQTPDTTMADIQADPFQFFSHAWPAIATLTAPWCGPAWPNQTAACGWPVDYGMHVNHVNWPSMTLQRRAVSKAPACSSMNLNLMAFGPRRTALLF